MTNLELIECIQAAERGEEVQQSRLGYVTEWFIKTNNFWNTTVFNYRIKPKEPTLVPHWPAIGKNADGNYITDPVFLDDNAARTWCGRTNYVRLCTEYPPIMLEVKE